MVHRIQEFLPEEESSFRVSDALPELVDATDVLLHETAKLGESAGISYEQGHGMAGVSGLSERISEKFAPRIGRCGLQDRCKITLKINSPTGNAADTTIDVSCPFSQGEGYESEGDAERQEEICTDQQYQARADFLGYAKETAKEIDAAKRAKVGAEAAVQAAERRLQELL